ncbi:aminoglycoside phosphotransferase family protein [Mechercharimyces sp. CAU 1602]|uniref:aminoglycoside phosphotransferase family protein n=1 Tax=Mechercharimyces sp. CAU 1602 TaxID=2973933 RepID=UPI0021613E57|nr:aminoglycoside phosphotransferase family protein [Mechercharimyces sp. CAU 1602]MCS1351084.1 aminoglycoside phosphotransferase family protein [Mechercharimyces sp. CAU 1602]
MIPLAEKDVQLLHRIYGEQGQKWIKELPLLLKHCEQAWSLNITSYFPISYNIVANAIQGERTVVVKLSLPGKEFEREAAALAYYEGRGAVNLLEMDVTRGALLLERVEPGESLKSVPDDEEATLIAATLIQELYQPKPRHSTFVHTRAMEVEWGKMKANPPFASEMIIRGEQLFSILHQTMPSEQFLHGDLHHDNILRSTEGTWRAIDPKGMVGEPTYQVLSFLLNHLPPKIEERITLTRRRIEIFASELQLDPVRIMQWGYCQALISAWWHIESRTEGETDALQMAEIFTALEAEIS